MKYTIKRTGRSVEISEATSSLLIYRIPYQNLSATRESIEITNKFIVYILYGENDSGKDVIYVGKSTNGLKNRPTSHEDKYNNWTYCYVLTQFKERTFFNDGTIQYIEDQVNKRVNEVNHYINTTVVTNGGTANSFDEEDCNAYLDKAYEMLDALGLDLLTYVDSETDKAEAEMTDNGAYIVPDGIYSLSRKIKRWKNQTVEAKMQVASGKFIVLADSDICPNEGPGVLDLVRIKRENAEIVNNKLVEDVVFDSPSAAASFVIAGAVNGWEAWKKPDGKSIDSFRNNK